MSNVIAHPKAASRRPARRKAPACPEHLSEHARTEWNRAVAAMVAAGTFGPEAAATLEAYCSAYARWREAEAHVAAHGALVPAPRTGTPMHNPFLAIGNKATDVMAKLAGELGLTPAGRKRVAAKAGTEGAGDGWDSDLLA